MIDRFFYKFFNSINNIFNWFTSPRCKCKLKGKIKEEEVLDVDKTFENEIKK